MLTILLFLILQHPVRIDPSTPTTLVSATITSIQTTTDTKGVVADLQFSVTIVTADGRKAVDKRRCGLQNRADQWVCGDTPAHLAANPALLKTVIARWAQALFDRSFVKDAPNDLQVVGGAATRGVVTVEVATPTTTPIDPTTIAPNAVLSADDISTILSQ